MKRIFLKIGKETLNNSIIMLEARVIPENSDLVHDEDNAKMNYCFISVYH